VKPVSRKEAKAETFDRILVVGVLVLSIILILRGMTLRASLTKVSLPDALRAQLCSKMWRTLLPRPLMIFALAFGFTVAVVDSLNSQVMSPLFFIVIVVATTHIYEAFSWRRLERYYRALHRVKLNPPS